ncbi:LacI family DNA-binding transcriptional regulator [Rhizobium leguminosarum bv. trifolii]|jgi:LacI family transcriptional regulator|uniref:LacI family DNA-binding transcriptional regulator n=1 Tax=Rhizobium ruizarguesonis TaxID=2081791 RepID=A0AAE4YNN7_9HYPH|nr:LacI family DNA-binding transcriptional regulator [Rhizobium ruizarguesonis]MBY5805292.1 LacI family DNA-binding transcriptional regulator [Rhizobium leguminosarum]NKL14307.1 substrate-binding domain-containing protein [Rhizobium leguminosarum bv. viciae]QIO47321.1 LacI family DNA-binding transcriptional regulator [Rhizobium leguminosarum bv. trifolii]MBY5845722.1 LacI family DNA-binding transcriptional regulator [Rhizobium leguminosarum]MBY5881366.1 LacI family DNA-binding transcriptional 
MRPTVHDIAAAAGVSLATVDRVLNQRPGVRHVTREKVETAIRELGYVRDVAAANLAKGRTYPLVFILPASDNSFMHGLNAEIRQAIVRSSAERTDIRTIEVPAFDPAALVAVLEGLSREKPCGIALVATDAPEVRAAVDRLVRERFPIVTLVSDLTGSLRHHYAGVDNIAAGRTAARLLGRFLGPRKGEIAVLAGSMLVRDHRERLEGFTAVMAEEFPDLAILPVLEGRDDPEVAHMLVADALGNAGIIGVYSLGAGNRGLIRALKEKAVDRVLTVIAHELTAHTRAALIDNTIDAILNQDAGHEVRSAIRVLKAKADGLAVIEAQERIRLDIFLKDNLP